MTNEFDNMQSVPVLTLEPFKEETKQEVVVVEEKPIVEEPVLSDEERAAVYAFANQIDLTNSSMILQYGAGTQKKMADFSETALEKVRTKDLGEVGELLSNVVGELKDFDADEEEKGFLGLFKKTTNKLDKMKTKYAKAETNINQICTVLESHQVQLMKDIAVLDKMYDLNLTYFKELSMYILAGKKKLQETRNGKLQEMIQKAQLSGLPEDAQAARDLEAMCTRFEKKIHDLELTRTISMQTAPQIRLVQGNDTMMVEKSQSTIVNTIPLWKSQMVLALGMANSNAAVEAQQAVSDTTNELLRKNAEALQQTTVNVARESERGIVDIQTLQETNQKLIDTIDEVMNIQTEGREKRKAAEAELLKIEQDLKAKLLEVRH